MPTQHQPVSPTDDLLSIIDRLSALPFPDSEVKPSTKGEWGGPGYHLAVLRESQDFWDDRSEDVVEAAEREMEADFAALAGSLTERWGAPETVDLGRYLGFAEPDPGFRAPKSLGFLSGVAVSMQVWRLPSSGRWVGLTIGQADPEWPLQLLVAFGDSSSLQ
ncbi:hypothetical protein JL475_28515 [Streptomyces sp. M2CJ-2]|uniref:hypothetical protein n=1 Tax=Streptomyces sp. M2CJ-2 TaxID=2803948 RepID=UPI001927D3A8|nr:hypothetical protein [Streptomyces sp. M2CJ-2]MBL3669858.1 hypothetical protein [Streptomyces sp. M2CJ-2]